MNSHQPKLIRVSTVAESSAILLQGQLDFLNQSYEVKVVCNPGPEIETITAREGVVVLPIKMARGISPFRDLIALWQLYRLFKKEQPTIVHSITPKAGLLGMLAAKWAKVPVRIHTFTGLIFPSKKGLLQKVLIFTDKLLCKAATHVVAESQGVAKELIRFGIYHNKIHFIGPGNVNGINSMYFNASAMSTTKAAERKALGLPETAIVFVFVGRLVADKGIRELVKAFVKLQGHYPNVFLILLGHEEPHLDPLSPNTKTTITQHDAIMPLGFKADIRPYLLAADALVLPSYREGFPNVILQALAMDLPCIATMVNGAEEAIQHQHNGLLVPKKDISALYQAMHRIATDNELRKSMSQNARASVLPKYEQSVVWAAQKAFYEQCLNNL
jgi:glycosyltransferase involved in cell wall biosynthesis